MCLDEAILGRILDLRLNLVRREVHQEIPSNLHNVQEAKKTFTGLLLGNKMIQHVPNHEYYLKLTDYTTNHTA